MRILATRRRKIVLLLSVLFIGASVFFVGRVWEMARDSGELACLSSIAGAVEQVDPVEMRKILGPIRGWQLLDDAKTDAVFRLVRPTDCAKAATTVPFRDRRGQRIRLRVKEDVPPGSYLIVVSTDGPGGMPQTDDDLVIPYKTNLNELK
jgi:hypothetical protein